MRLCKNNHWHIGQHQFSKGNTHKRIENTPERYVPKFGVFTGSQEGGGSSKNEFTGDKARMNVT